MCVRERVRERAREEIGLCDLVGSFLVCERKGRPVCLCVCETEYEWNRPHVCVYVQDKGKHVFLFACLPTRMCVYLSVCVWVPRSQCSPQAV